MVSESNGHLIEPQKIENATESKYDDYSEYSG